MTDLSKRLAQLSPVKRALLALELDKRGNGRATDEENLIAIVGIGCRFPGGVENADDFWQLLRTGTDAIVEVPPSRWDANYYYDPDPDAPGRMNTGFVDPISA